MTAAYTLWILSGVASIGAVTVARKSLTAAIAMHLGALVCFVAPFALGYAGVLS